MMIDMFQLSKLRLADDACKCYAQLHLARHNICNVLSNIPTTYRKSSIKPPPPGGLFISFSPRGGLKREGGLLERGLLKFEAKKVLKMPLSIFLL